VRTRLAALAVVYLAAHLAYLPPTLEDIDSINFAMGVRDFDVARHQPHPPGYPLFIALGKMSTPALAAIGVPGAEVRGLAVWSAVFGALLIPLLFALFRAVDGDDWRAFWAAAFAACSPLVWSTAVRPLSDVTGLALAVGAQALLVAALTGRSSALALSAGAFLGGLAAGVRIQTAMLTGPVLIVALLFASGVTVAARLRALIAAGAGVTLWMVPLMVASGGVGDYITALGAQAGEDFGGVVMLYTTRTPRVVLNALMDSFVLPWGTPLVGAIVLALAIGGLLRLLGARLWRVIGLLAVLFLPYAVFHLLFHETVTMRYALPLVIPVAYLVVRAVNTGTRWVVAELALITLFLIMSVPAMTAFARDGSPAVAAMRDALSTGTTTGAHAGMRRVWEWEGARSSTRFLTAPHGREWLTLIEEWKQNPSAPIEFLANPRRTDLVLIDLRAARAMTTYDWSFAEVPFVAGARPGAVNRFVFDPPGWMLDRGWALTAEIRGVSERDGAGPQRTPSMAWIRARDGSATVMVGGRNLGAAGDADALISIELKGRRIAELRVEPGFFLERMPLPAGSLSGSGYLPLAVSAAPAAAGRGVAVALEQFDLQDDGVPMAGVDTGWHEPEYNPLTGRAWRWMSEKSAVWVRPIGRNVHVTITAESPLEYFESAPLLRAMLGGVEVATLSPASDFTWQFVLPAAPLEAAGGRVVIESDKWFVPEERGGPPDRRHLALRVYSLTVK
jgi:hypothetical protein